MGLSLTSHLRKCGDLIVLSYLIIATIYSTPHSRNETYCTSTLCHKNKIQLTLIHPSIISRIVHIECYN